MGIGIVSSDSKNLSIILGKTTRLITERANLCRSATPKVARIKREYDVLVLIGFTELVRFAIAVNSNKIRGGLSNRYLWQDLVKQCDDIFAVRFGVNFPINGTDVSSFINDKSRPF